jgi:eukaryotic-like serine/threonine-protein kinase
MTERFSDEQWRTIFDLAQAALEIPGPERAGFVESRSPNPEVVSEVLRLAEELEHPEETPDLSGSSVGRFVLMDYLGGGGAGDVYSAKDPELGRIVAIKLLRLESGMREAQERFIREARAVSAFNHPNIVTVHEVIRTGSTLAIVMELVDGVPLRQLSGKPLPIARLLSIGQQIADALLAAHGAGIVHRDIKPENVMLLSDGRIKVLDFGLARQITDTHEASVNSVVPAGTLRYMSPEHYRGQPVTARSDMFAFGIVLYELGAGRHPFPTDSPLEVLHAIATVEPEPPSRLNPEISPLLESTILKMLDKDPSKRLSAVQVADALRQSEGRAEVPKFRPKRPARALLLTAAILLLALTVGIWRFLPPRGAFKKLEQITNLIPENSPTAAAISPDGKFLAYANIDGIFLKTIPGDETTTLNGPGHFIVDRLAWFPDGAKLLTSGFSEETNRPSIWSISITGAKPLELRSDARFGTPSPDGSRIAFLQGDYSSIWTMTAEGQDEKRVVNGPSTDSFTAVLWSGSGRHLLFERRHYSGRQEVGFIMFDRFYARSVESASADTGVIVEKLPDWSLRSALSLPRGEVLLLGGPKPGTNRSHVLWTTRMDSAGKFRGGLKILGAPLDKDNYNFHPSATEDGSKLAVIKQSTRESVFVADFDRAAVRLSNARELTLDSRACYPHAWTLDSESVIYEAGRSGGYDIFKQRIEQRVPESILVSPSKRWNVFPQLTPDGLSVLYAAGPTSGAAGPYTLRRVAFDGGVATQVPIGGTLDEFRCSVGRKGRCVLRTTIDRNTFIYSELDPIRGIGRELARTAWMTSVLGDWDVSPDGNFVAIPNHDSRSARIRIVRLGARRSNEPAEREFEIPRVASISSVTWSTDQSGWFVSLETSVGRRMYFYDNSGQLTSLGTIHGWAVPSPDGKKLAYLDNINDANVWLLSR